MGVIYCFNSGAFEGDARIVFNIEEISTLEVVIAVCDFGINGAGINGGFYRSGRGVSSIKGDGAGGTRKLTANLANHHVANGELCGRVYRINIPSRHGVAPH